MFGYKQKIENLKFMLQIRYIFELHLGLLEIISAKTSLLKEVKIELSLKTQNHVNSIPPSKNCVYKTSSQPSQSPCPHLVTFYMYLTSILADICKDLQVKYDSCWTCQMASS